MRRGDAVAEQEAALSGKPTVLAVDATGTVVSVNADFEETAGFCRYEILGRPVEAIREKTAPVLYRAIEGALRDAGNLGETLRFTDQEASSGREEISVSPIVDSIGRAARIVTIRRTAPPRPGGFDGYSRDGRRSHVDRIVGAFAHHFNNLLTPVLGHAGRILSRQSCTPEACSDAETILRAGERAASMIDRLLTFAGRSSLDPQVLDLNALVSGMVPRILGVIGPGIEFDTRLAPRIRRVIADPGQAERLLLDLVANACEAMPRGGRLLVETSGIENGRVRIRPGVKIAPGSYAALTVRDTGAGMDAYTRARAFDPFFTTKHGAPGLGLSSAYGFMKRSGGYIWIDGAPGKGALATACFPCAEPGGAERDGASA